MSIFKNLIDSSTGTAVYVNCDQIAFVAPTSSGGSRISVTAPPATVLSGETVS